jgi:hypothetical protein
MNAKISAEVDAAKSSIPVPAIRIALHDILHSEAFSNSKRCCDFLAYVVEQALAGSQHELKERTIAVAVFGRTPSYDAHEDAIVRIKASEVRKRLGHYYASEGRGAAIRVSLPRGGYVPVFAPFDRRVEEVLLDPPAENIGETGQLDAIRGSSAVPAQAPKRGQKILLAFACGALIVAGVSAWFHTRPQTTFLEQFWAPALRNSEPVYLVAAAAPVFVSYAPGESLPLSNRTEYVAVDDQFVGEGDLLASHLIASMLQAMHQPYEVKGNNTVDVRDLPTRTVVLIGYSSTKWESICKQLRFYIDADKAGMITDRGKETEWYPHHVTKDLHTDEDYAIVSRFLDPSTRAMVVLVSGSEQYGTEGAAMLVTNAELLRNALRDRPTGWENKNLQIVLHMKVIANSPATPEVVATYYW